MRFVVGCWLALLAVNGSAAEFVFSREKITAAYEELRPVLELPLPDGTIHAFALEKTTFVPSSTPFAIRAFSGRALDDSTTTAHVVLTPDSISAQIFIDGTTVYLNSVRDADGKVRLRNEVEQTRGKFDYRCLTEFSPAPPRREGMVKAQSAGHVLRKFRLAPAATAEYTEFFGSKEEAVRQVVIAINRASGIFHRELGISFELVAGFERMVFTDKDSDPYTTNEPTEDLLKEAQAGFDSIIGTQNYDLGIVLTRGTYGLAYIRSVCDPARKGSSCIGLPEPIGDAFHVNLVTHELAHQFGANHTFNSPTGLCAERRSASTAFEPGAGSTIMSYASLPCGADSFQPDNDAYFHSESLKEILDFVNSPVAACAVITPVENTAPMVNAGHEHLIPVGTPFALSATASDAQGDAITYAWEERDLGPAQELGAGDNGFSPLFRSFPPSASPTRMFPALERVLAGGDAPDERLPQTNRILRFRVVARDSRAHGALAWSDLQLRVVNSGGPFRITSHTTPQTLSETTRVEWSTGGTAQAPISAAQVRITLSTDGGLTFPIVLAEATPNDGVEEVPIPNLHSQNVRLKVEPTNNIFFDISDAVLSVGTVTALTLQTAILSDGRLRISWPSEAGSIYRLESANGLPAGNWTEVLHTNAAQSSVTVNMPAAQSAAYYRVVQN